MLDDTTIQLLAARAASILCEWANLDPLRKNDNGCPDTGVLTMLLGAMADKGVAPPSDAHERLTKALVERLTAETRARGPEGIYFTLGVDYHPDGTLRDLAAAAGVDVSWPIKSHLRISSPYSDGSGDLSVSDSQGYRSPTTTYKLLDGGRGWLITTGFSVDRRITDLCLDAAKAGHPALKWEPIGG